MCARVKSGATVDDTKCVMVSDELFKAFSFSLWYLGPSLS